MADVGCDTTLSGVWHWNSIEHIRSDISIAAAKGALSHYESEEANRDKLELLIGDGLAPLVEKGATSYDTLILSGMGT